MIKKNPWKIFRLSLFGLIGVFLFNVIYYSIIPNYYYSQRFQFFQQMLHDTPLKTIFEVVIFFPIFEEILFRGFLFDIVLKYCGKWTILISSVVFSTLHFDMYNFTPIFVDGLLFGWSRKESGTVLIPIIIHMINNAFALLLL